MSYSEAKFKVFMSLVTLVIVSALVGWGLSIHFHKCPEPIPIDNRAFEMQIGLLEDEIALQHRDNDRLRQWLLGDLLSDGRLPPIEGLVDDE